MLSDRKLRVRRVLAVLLCLAMTVTMNTGVFASEKPAGEVLFETEAMEGIGTVSAEVTAENREKNEADILSEDSLNSEAGDENSISGDQAAIEDMEVSENETEIGEAAGDTQVDAPEGWKVTGTSQNPAVWYETYTNKYEVVFNESAYIGYYPDSYDETTQAYVTVKKVSGDDIKVIVEGGDYGQGTKVHVDSSLSDNVYVAHGSIYDTGSSYVRVQGLDDAGDDPGDYTSEDRKYESDLTVYKENKFAGRVDYTNATIILGNDERTTQVFDADNKNLLISGTAYNYSAYSADKMAEAAKDNGKGFVVKSETNGFSWIEVKKRAEAPDTRPDVYLEQDNYNVYAKDKSTHKIYTADSGQFLISGNYTEEEKGLIGGIYPTELSFSKYKIGQAFSDNYSLYMRSVSTDCFPSGWVKTSAEPLFIVHRRPEKDDIETIRLSEDSIEINGSYSHENYADKRGVSRIRYIVTESGVSVSTVSSVSVNNWQLAIYNNPAKFNVAVNSSGELVNIGKEKNYDIYAAWFLPKYDGGEKDDYAMGDMEGTPVKLFTVENSGSGTAVSPEIDFYDRSFEYSEDDHALMTEKDIQDYFRAHIGDYDYINGEFTVKVISVNDAHVSDFLAQNDFEEGSYGRDVTEEGQWDIGEYYIAAYFEPYYDRLGDDIYLPTYKLFDFTVEVTKKTLEIALSLTDDLTDGWMTVPIGYTVSYDDIKYNLYTYVKDESGYSKRKDLTDYSLRDVKFAIRLTSGDYEDIFEDGWTYGKYDYDKGYILEKSGDSFTFDEYRTFNIYIFIESAKIYDGEERVDSVYRIRGMQDKSLAKLPSYTWGTYNTTESYYNINVIEKAGNVSISSNGNPLYYGILNRIREDEINHKSSAATYKKEQMGKVVTVYCDGADITTKKRSGSEKADMLTYAFSTEKNGEYKRLKYMDPSDLEAGDKVWIKADMMKSSECDPVEVRIEKQPFNLGSVCKTTTALGEDLKTTYSDDLYVYMIDPCNGIDKREERSSFTEWNSTASAPIDVSGINKNITGSHEVGIGITLNAAKASNYDLRSAAALYVVRSDGAITVDKSHYRIEFKNAKTGDTIAEAQTLDETEAASIADINLNDRVYGWSVEFDDSGDRIFITEKDIISSNGTTWSFDLQKTLSLINSSNAGKITYYADMDKPDDVTEYIKISKINDVTYTGKEHVSSKYTKKNKSADLYITVYLYSNNGNTVTLLEEGRDYKLTYKKNKDAGSGEVTLTGLGVYKGMRSKQYYTIKAADITDADIEVKQSYKYTGKGLTVSPKVKCGGLTLKNNRDYTYYLIDASGNKVNGSDYKNDKEVRKFRLKVTGEGNYTNFVTSSEFFGVPSHLKALNVKLKKSSVKYKDNKTTVSAADFGASVTNYKGDIKVELFDDSYNRVVDGVAANTGVYYYVGVSPSDPDVALSSNISPVTVYKKVKFLGLPFSKKMFKLNQTAFDFSNNKNFVQLLEKNEGSVSWDDISVTFAGNYAEDGHGKLVCGYGKQNPSANDTDDEKTTLGNTYPDKYYVYITGKGRYSGTINLTYEVKSMKGKLGDNVVISVNEGKAVSYNASGYDENSAPITIALKDKKGNLTDISGLSRVAVYNKKSRAGANGGRLVIKRVFGSNGVEVFSNKLTVLFDVAQCDLQDALNKEISKNGAVRPLTVNLGATVPTLTLKQSGANGWTGLARTDFSLIDNIREKASLSSDFSLKIKASGKNYLGNEVTVSGIDAYKETIKKAKLSVTLSDNGLETGNKYGSKNRKTNKYFTYTGNAVEPGIVVKDKDGKIISDDYYDVEYSNNIYYSSTKNPAIATVTFKRPSNGDFLYGGSVELKFYIVTDYQ